MQKKISFYYSYPQNLLTGCCSFTHVLGFPARTLPTLAQLPDTKKKNIRLSGLMGKSAMTYMVKHIFNLV